MKESYDSHSHYYMRNIITSKNQKQSIEVLLYNMVYNNKAVLRYFEDFWSSTPDNWEYSSDIYVICEKLFLGISDDGFISDKPVKTISYDDILHFYVKNTSINISNVLLILCMTLFHALGSDIAFYDKMLYRYFDILDEKTQDRIRNYVFTHLEN